MARHCSWPHRNTPPFPGGELLPDSSRTYADTLKRHGTQGLLKDAALVLEQWHGIIFEPAIYARVVEEMLIATGNCSIWYNASFLSTECSEGKVISVEVQHNQNLKHVAAKYFIDTTADAQLCQSSGCEARTGEDPQSLYHEPHAPETAGARSINAVTLIYRVTRNMSRRLDLPVWDASPDCWFRRGWPYAAIGQYPDGDFNINMLPTMEGAEFLDYVESGKDGYAKAYAECYRRVLGHWNFIQQHFPEFQTCAIQYIAPSLGVRETRRVIGEYVLTEQDVVNGLSKQKHQDIIALADHALDTHGENSRGCPELDQPYGIPYRCLIPKGSRNLLIAGRCASFSHIAASSCRLSRTMMDLGHAAGAAAVIAFDDKADISGIDISLLQKRLISQGATLSQPAR
ncbi:MAG: FAD-dependent oxidoreductase [Candidatus Methylacidiphilales bacterium]